MTSRHPHAVKRVTSKLTSTQLTCCQAYAEVWHGMLGVAAGAKVEIYVFAAHD